MRDSDVSYQSVFSLIQSFLLLAQNIRLNAGTASGARLWMDLRACRVVSLAVREIDILQTVLRVQLGEGLVAELEAWDWVLRVEIVAEVLGEVVVDGHLLHLKL